MGIDNIQIQFNKAYVMSMAVGVLDPVPGAQKDPWISLGKGKGGDPRSPVYQRLRPWVLD